MRNLGEYVLGGDQEFRVDDRVTFRGRNYNCVEYVPRWFKKAPPDDAEHWEDVTPATATPAVVPQWAKFSVPFSAFSAGELEPDNTDLFRVPIVELPIGSYIHDAFMKPLESLTLDPEAEMSAPELTASIISTTIGFSVPGENVYASMILDWGTGYGGTPGIENDPSYLMRATLSASLNLFPQNTGGANAPRTIYMYLAFDGQPGVAQFSDFAALTAGGIDLWMLISVAPDYPIFPA